MDDFIDALQAHRIATLADIRAFPVSRRLPHFNRESLERVLPGNGLGYVWMKALGGYRKKIRKDSPHVALRSDSFRNYADYTLTAEFAHAMGALLTLAEEAPAAYMCAERLYYQCHRMIVSDWLVAHGHQVLHIDGEGPVSAHQLSAEARVIEGQLIYRGELLF